MPLIASILLQLATSIVLTVVSVSLRTKATKKTGPGKLEDPVASAGRPIPIVFGTLTIKDPNIVGFSDKQSRKRSI